jgi:hypothetical protein
MPRTATKPTTATENKSARAELITKINAGEAACRRQSEIIAELESKLGPLGVHDLGRLCAGLTLDSKQRQTDQFVIERTDEYQRLEDVRHEGAIAARDLRENPPGWLVDRRRELLKLISEHEQAIARANRELRHLNDQLPEADPQPFNDDGT